MMPEGLEAMGGVPPGAFWPSWPLSHYFKAVSSSFRENISVVFFLELIGVWKVPETAKYEK